MSYTNADRFVYELSQDEEATARADAAYLNAVAEVAAEQGYDISIDEICDAMRAIAGLDDEVEGFQFDKRVMGGIDESTVFTGGWNANTVTAATVHGNTVTQNFVGRFTPLGFMR
jgi:hypothetical protein